METIICFDLDGPILDVSARYYQLYADYVKMQDAIPLPKRVYWSWKRQKISEDIILRKTGLDDKTLAYLSFRKEHIESPHYLDYDRIWPGIFDMLKKISSRYRVLLVTFRVQSKELMNQLVALDLTSFFDNVLTRVAKGDSLTRGQLKANLILSAQQGKPFKGLIVGDTETEIIAGKLLNLNTVAVSFGIRVAKHLKKEESRY